MLYGYTMILVGELQAARILVLPFPQIPGQGSIIPLYEPGYIPAPLGSLGGWDSFAQASEPSQDLGYAPSTSGGAGPSTGPFTDDDDDDDTD